MQNAAPTGPNEGVKRKFNPMFTSAEVTVIHMVCCTFLVMLIPIDTIKYAFVKNTLAQRKGTTAFAE